LLLSLLLLQLVAPHTLLPLLLLLLLMVRCQWQQPTLCQRHMWRGQQQPMALLATNRRRRSSSNTNLSSSSSSSSIPPLVVMWFTWVTRPWSTTHNSQGRQQHWCHQHHWGWQGQGPLLPAPPLLLVLLLLVQQ
jgi:hypothetical protein